MSFCDLPYEIRLKLLEECPQLRFVFREFRTLLSNFEKPPDLDYPTKMNKYRKPIIIEHKSTPKVVQDKLQLKFRNRNMECIATINDISRVQCVAFHNFLPLLITGCNNGFIKIYELNDDKTSTSCVVCFQAHYDVILSIAFHSSALIFATASVDFNIKLWSFNFKGKQIEHIITLTEHTSYVKKIMFHPFLSTILASASHDSKVKLWSMDTENPKNINCVCTLQAHTNSANALDFHSTKELLATAGYDHQIKIWLLNESSTEARFLLSLEGHRHLVNSVKFYKSYLASGGFDSSVKIWLFNENYTDAICITSLDNSFPVYSISFHKSGLLASGTHSGIVNIWQFDEKNKNAIHKTTQKKHEYNISCVVFSQDVEDIVLATCGDTSIKLWR